MTPIVQEPHPGGRPLLWKSPKELDNRIEAYKAHCEASNEPFTISGLAVALGCDRRTLVDYAHRDQFLPPIKKARAYAESWLERQLLSGKSPIGAIFVAKNNFGWRDKSEIEHTHYLTIADVLRQIESSKEPEYGHLGSFIDGDIVQE